MKIKKSIGETFRKITKPKGRELVIKRGNSKHATERKNRDRLNRCLSQMTAALSGASASHKEASNMILQGSAENLYRAKTSQDAHSIAPKGDSLTPKTQPRGMKDIFKSLKNLRSRSNIKRSSNKNLHRVLQTQSHVALSIPYTPPINDLCAEPTRRMPQRRLFSRARSNLDTSALSSKHYSLSTVICPDTTMYSHPQPIFIESDADISFPQLSSTPLTAKIGSPRFASTPTSDKHASIISRIDHVIESSANQCSKIFETGHSVHLKLALEPLFKESCEAAEGMWRPWV